MVELTWDVKYDSNGKRVAPLRLKLPFQTVETVNASMQQRQIALDLFSAGRPAEWRKRLIWVDKNTSSLPCWMNSPEDLIAWNRWGCFRQG